MPDVAEIAGRLSEAQIKTLLGDEDSLTWHNEEGLAFMEPPLVDTEEHYDGYDMWFTDLGLAVRAYLENSRD